MSLGCVRMHPAIWVERHGRLRPDEPAIAVGERVHASWVTFAARTAATAAGLRDRFGLSPGDRVAIGCGIARVHGGDVQRMARRSRGRVG